MSYDIGRITGLKLGIHKRISEGNTQIFLAFFLMIFLFVLSLFMGRYSIPPQTIMTNIIFWFLSLGNVEPSNVGTVIFQIRLPRIIAAMLVGAGLSISGASFQGLFRNPLVSPYILGVASGAGFGACLGILISENIFVIQLMA